MTSKTLRVWPVPVSRGVSQHPLLARFSPATPAFLFPCEHAQPAHLRAPTHTYCPPAYAHPSNPLLSTQTSGSSDPP